MFDNKIFIKNKSISNNRCFIVAEISANHCGSLDKLKKLIIKLKKINVDAIKIQAYEANTITINSNKKDFKIKKNNKWARFDTLFKLYKKAQTPFSWYKELFKFCNKNNIILFASVFDSTSLQLLEKLQCPAYKIASPEITDIPLIEKVANTKKPIFISTGLGNAEDINLAVKSIKRKKNKKLIILKCTSSYPADFDELNLKTMAHITKKYKCLSGFSDHTKNIGASIHAASIGATVLEKHVMLKKDKSVDSFFSLDVDEFREMIKTIRNNEIANGKVDYSISKNSKKNLNGRRSLYVVAKIKKGQKFTNKNVKSIRPCYGLHPKFLNRILSKKSKRNLNPGDRLTLNDISK